ncbi:sporulation protein YqfD [Clostridium sp. Cult3]|uniref:sporulation protein YqfD n=1 Tax=Clostridium sp. Cult3 TaxID=2079004 RepID=UPI001EFFA895|nr:sporulation protein YqfD [Clostridium sp. Cult3]MCF6461077.1 sporulation protein YqfD [Clostridium sp. Cult3]
MEVIKTWNYLRGYVIIKVEGLTLERFLNLAADQDIYLWDIKRINYTLLEMKVSTKGFKALKEIVRKVGCRVEIVEKKGLPFIIYRLKNRKMLGFGILIFFSLILVLSSFIWSIEVLGLEKISKMDIIRVLEGENIRPGIIKYNIDKDYISSLLLNGFEHISFASIDIKGTKLIVSIYEQDIPPEKLDINIPCHIIAKKKGVIVKAIVKNGKTMVRKGDVVKKGQVLIAGMITDENTEDTIPIHAEGEVLAKTRYYYRLDEPIVKTIEEKTGNIVEVHEIRFGEKGIQFFKEDIPFNHYIENIREIKPFKERINLPFKLLVHEYIELEKKEAKQNIEFLKKSSYIKAIEQLNKEIPEDAQIESKDVIYNIEKGILSTQVVIEVVEDIGQKQIININ